jgi:hypothetical protein
MKSPLVLAAALLFPLLGRAEVPAYDFRQPLRDGVAVVGMECHKKNGTLEVGIYYGSDGPLKRMDLWKASDLVEVDPKSFDVQATRQVERSCTLGADHYRVRFVGLPGAANAMWMCGAAMSATVTIWKNGRQVFKDNLDKACGEEPGIRSVLLRSSADRPEITRSPRR